MVSRWCIVQEGVVINTVLWDGETPWEVPEGCEAILESEATDLPRPTIEVEEE